MRSDSVAIPEHIKAMMEREHIFSVRQLSEASGISVSKIYRGFSTGRFTSRSAEALSNSLRCKPNDIGKIVEDKPGGKFNQRDTLCLSCINAVPDLEGHGCSWSVSAKPVKGWTAQKSEKADGGSWRIIKCPEFKRG